jgi:hypothetical protein
MLGHKISWQIAKANAVFLCISDLPFSQRVRGARTERANRGRPMSKRQIDFK